MPSASESNRVKTVLAILQDHPEGLTGRELLAALRRRWPRLSEGRAWGLVKEAGDLVVEDHDRFRLAKATRPTESDPVGSPRRQPLRAVALDLEALVRPTAKRPYLERAIWQLGAVRFGRDAEWVAERPHMVRYCELAAGFTLEDPTRAATHAARQRPMAAVLTELAEFCSDADVLVAYNGRALDFPLLDAACDAAEIPRIDRPARVDGMYLALAMWPLAASGHRLQPLARHVGLEVDDLSWHDAGDDAELLARLLVQGASQVVAGWRPELVDLAASVGTFSSAWQFLIDLTGTEAAIGPRDDTEVSALIDAELASQPYKQGSRAPARPVEQFEVPQSWKRPDGRIDPFLLSAAVSRGAERRPTQDQMAEAIRRAIENERDLAVEAPTGTGKSLAVLAAAIEWLAGDPRRRVVIATHTKQLQTQLAADVERLSRSAPVLLHHATIVKGAANRLSLRALVSILADLSQQPAGARRHRIMGEPDFAELVLFILLRLLAEPVGLLEEHETRSVDLSDVPPFFDEYTGGRWGADLALLSQGAADDYRRPDGLGARTWSAAEQLAAYRLVIANHALVFAHLEDLTARAEQTLLVVDEAHALEQTVTEAIGAVVSYPAIEHAVRLLSAWAARADADPRLVDIARGLEDALDNERIPKAAMQAADTLAGPPQEGQPRAASLASPFAGDVSARAVHRLLADLGSIARRSGAAAAVLRAWSSASRETLSRREQERLLDLVQRLSAIADSAGEVVRDVDRLWGTSYSQPSLSPPTADGAGPESVDRDATGQPPTEPAAIDELDADAGSDDEGTDESAAPEDQEAYEAGAVEPRDANLEAVPQGNRVVWLAEQLGSRLAAGPRGYRFEVRTSPIRLPAESAWRRFRRLFGRTIFTSATLTVAGAWDFLLDRLGLDDCERLVLDGGFDYRTQARLVCFSDFPSWAEHTEAAMRSVAHQVVGYAAEAVAAGRTPGAMALTTSTAAAAGIAEHLALMTGARELHVSLAAAPVLGNARAVEEFRSAGGYLVGTKGLWAGMDIPEPDRVRILWINKLPFAPYQDPLVATRRAEVAKRAEAEGADDPEAAATQRFYLPLGAIELRQAVGRLLRSPNHRGVIVISDRKLAGTAALRRLYRRIFLGSLDPGLLLPDEAAGNSSGGNVTTMVEGWERIWRFLAEGRDIDPDRLPALLEPAALERQTLLPQTLQIRDLALDSAEVEAHRAAGTLEAEVLDRCARIGGLLRFMDAALTLKKAQREAIAAVARGDDLLALLPTGYGKSYCFQLPALVMPGTTIVVSPLVALMVDQALELNRAIGGAVRALVAPLRESSSRAGRQEVAEQLTGVTDHGIRMVYVSPERFAQRQFREWVRAGVASGRVSRIVLDEAHTLVQWGDDFRPAYRRFASTLVGLRAVAPGMRLPVSALTATANRSVREGLRTRLFGLSATRPPSGDPAGFAFVAVDPIRPELAVYRLQLRSGGPVTVARHVESVFDALDGHAVFYCLTIREVDALWAHLREYVGPAEAVRIRRFHSRLPEAEKASVLIDFRHAPRRHEEGFAPIVVVATSAFGLGIDRDDIRCVFVTSPPTDLAALYQQLGRAGRDARAIPGPGDQVNAAIAMATQRGFRTVEFLARDLPAGILIAAARRVLRCGGLLDADDLASGLIDTEVASGRLRPEQAARDLTRDTYRTAVLRALAALVDAGAVDDLGDFPATVRLTRGEVPPPVDSDRDAALARAVADWVAADAHRAQRASVVGLHEALAAAGLADLTDPAATWMAVVDLHHAGVVDVSQAPNRRWLTAIRIHTSDLPPGYESAIASRRLRAAAELADLRAWYADSHCANQGLADYFAPTPPGLLPAGTCSTAECFCLACWGARGTGMPPRILEALLRPHPRLASAEEDRLRRARLDAAVEKLLRDNRMGLGVRLLLLCLRGVDTYYDTRAQRRRPLPSRLLYHRLFGSRPGLREPALVASLERLESAGATITDGRRRHRSSANSIVGPAIRVEAPR